MAHCPSWQVKVNDVQLICDKHTGRSKGFGYVELKALEDVPKALVLNGQPFRFRKGKVNESATSSCGYNSCLLVCVVCV